MEKLPPHVARLVRDKTTRSSAKLFDAAMEVAQRRLMQSTKRGVPPQKLVPVITAATHSELTRAGVGLGFMLTRHPRYRKRIASILGSWAGFTNEDDSVELLAEYRAINRVGVGRYMTCRVSRHALERVAERKGTIYPADIRAELAPAVNGLLLASAQEVTPHAGDELVVPTDNGLAMARWGDARVHRAERHALVVPTITTWMDWASIPAGSALRTLAWDYFEPGDSKLVTASFAGCNPALPKPKPRPRGNTNEEDQGP